MLFKFKSSALENLKAPKIYMGLSEHNQELRERIFHLIILLIILLFISLSQVKGLTQFLQGAIDGIRFFQPSPEEYFFLSFKLSFSTALLLESPIFLSYGVCYLFPGLLNREKFAFGSLLFLSATLFFAASIYTYKVIAPAALTFFFSFTKDILEPLWSFQQYVDFLWTLFLGSVYSFQIPTIQIICGFIGICNAKQCLNWLRYVLLISTIVAAIITPSTDPLTQIIFSLAILILYFTGTTLLFSLEKFKIIC